MASNKTVIQQHKVSKVKITAQQSVHLTSGIRLAKSGLYLASSFFCGDNESTPTPPQVTQTVRRFLAQQKNYDNQESIQYAAQNRNVD